MALGCFRKMGVVALAEAKVRRVFGGKEADERLSLHEVVLREAAELRRLIALPAMPAWVLARAGPTSSLHLEADTPAPTTKGKEAWFDGACGALGAIPIDDASPGFGALPPLSGLALASHYGSPVCPSTTTVDSPPRSDSPGRTPMASPLSAEALLRPFRAMPVAPLMPATSIRAGLDGDAADTPEKTSTPASSIQSGHEDAAASV